MQTTSVANPNPAGVPAWSDVTAPEGAGGGQLAPVHSGAEEVSSEELAKLIAKGVKEGGGSADGVFNANGAPALETAKSFSMSDMVDLLRTMQSKNQEVQMQTAKEGIQNDMTKKEQNNATQNKKIEEWIQKCQDAKKQSTISKIFGWIGKIVAVVASALFLAVATGLTGLTGGLGAPMVALATMALIGSTMALADQISREYGGPEISLTNLVTTMVAKTLEACGVDAETAERIGKIAAGAVAIMLPVVLVVEPGMLGAMATGIAELAGADANQAALAAMIVTIATALTVGIVTGVLTGGASTAGTAAKIATTIIGASSAIIQGSLGIAKGANDLKVADMQHDAEYARAEQQKLLAICLELQNHMEEGMEELKKVMEAMDESMQIVSQMLKDGADSMVQVAANIGKRQPI
ncbi:type III secretion system translocon subunit SctE [Achromobacter xylosoxidans]